MKTAITIMRDGEPARPENVDVSTKYLYGYWPDTGSAYDTASLIDALGLPTPMELVKRESKIISSIGTNDELVSMYSPDWAKLKSAFETLERILENIMSTTDGLLTAVICEVPNLVYSDHPIKSGADALAMHSDMNEKHKLSVETRFGHFFKENSTSIRIKSIVRGVTTNSDGLYVPCVYIVFDGHMQKLLDAIKVCIIDCEAAIANMKEYEYTITIRQKNTRL